MINGKWVNEYYAGIADEMAPFFFVAHGLALPTGDLPDGYSKFYKIVFIGYDRNLMFGIEAFND